MPWEVWLCKRGNGLFRRLRFGFSGGLTLGVSNVIIPTMTDDATCSQKAAKSRAGAEKAERLARALRDNLKRRKATSAPVGRRQIATIGQIGGVERIGRLSDFIVPSPAVERRLPGETP